MTDSANLQLFLWFVAAVATITVLGSILLGRGIVVRYLIAMVFAAIGALVATLFISSAVAGYVTSRMTFESPDGVEFVHATVWLGVNVGSLLLGWLIGWFLSWPVVRRRKVI